MKAILKWFIAEEINPLSEKGFWPHIAIQQFNNGDKIKVIVLKDDRIRIGRKFPIYVDGIVTQVFKDTIEVKFLESNETKIELNKNCYKVLGEVTQKAYKMITKTPFIQMNFFKANTEIEVQEETKDYGFAGKHGTGVYKVKCICCDDFK